MQRSLLAGIAALSVVVATPAFAQNVSGSQTQLVGTSLTLNSSGLYNGSTLVAALTGGAVYTSGSPNVAAEPVGTTGSFLAAGPDSGGGAAAVLTFVNPVTSLGFLWGSPDTYNSLTFTTNTGATKNFQGFYAPGTGDQNLSAYFTFTADPGQLIKSVSFSNVPSQNAFEVSNFSVSAAPEPATWGMMIIGFGAAGIAMRRSRKKVTVRYA